MGASAFAAHGALAQTALEQDMRYQDTATMTVGETVISLGGGFAYLTLPDTRFTFRYKDSGTFNTASKQKNDAFDEYGGGFSGTVSTPLGGAFGMPWVGAVHGYWSNIENTNRNRCVSTNSFDLRCVEYRRHAGSLHGQRRHAHLAHRAATSTAGAWRSSSPRQMRGPCLCQAS